MLTYGDPRYYWGIPLRDSPGGGNVKDSLV